MTVEFEIARSENEGYGFGPENREEMIFGIFLSRIVDVFNADSNITEVQNAVPVVLKEWGLSPESKKVLVEAAKMHFLPVVCKLHTPDIINFSDADEYAQEDEEVLVITADNLAEHLSGEGELVSALREHLKFSMKMSEWRKIKDTEDKRFSQDYVKSERYGAGTPG